jgi:hypothetical protein
VLSTLAFPAHADDTATAEALFSEGRALMDHGEVDRACDKFAESQRLDASSGTLLNLAACHERQKKLTTAWAEYRAAERLATSQGKEVRIAEAHRKATELEPQLSRLTIDVQGPVPGLVVTRDRMRLDSGGFGSSLPLDGGKHRISASAPHHETVVFDVTMAERGDQRTLVIPALRSVPEPALPKEKSIIAPDPTSANAPRDLTPGFIAVGSGIALAGASGLFFALSISADIKAKAGCRWEYKYACSEDALNQGDRRDTFASLATVGGVGAILGIGIGTWLLVSPHKKAPPSAHARIVPQLAHGGGGLSVEGAF